MEDSFIGLLRLLDAGVLGHLGCSVKEVEAMGELGQLGWRMLYSDKTVGQGLSAWGPQALCFSCSSV